MNRKNFLSLVVAVAALAAMALSCGGGGSNGYPLGPGPTPTPPYPTPTPDSSVSVSFISARPPCGSGAHVVNGDINNSIEISFHVERGSFNQVMTGMAFLYKRGGERIDTSCGSTRFITQSGDYTIYCWTSWKGESERFELTLSPINSQEVVARQVVECGWIFQ